MIPAVSNWQSAHLDRLLEVLLPRGGHIVALFDAYLDESGTHDGSNVLAVAAYLVEVGQARRMDQEWAEALQEYGIPYFHMVECAHGNKVFEGRKDNVDIEKRFIAIIKKYTTIGVTALVNPFRYRPGGNVPPEAYAFCLDVCILAMCNNVDQQKDKIAFFIESGHESRSLASRHIIELEKQSPSPAYASHTFGKKEDIRILQAADLLAWQSTKYIKDKIESKRPPRKDFESLMAHKHWFAYFMLGVPDGEVKLDLNPLIGNPRYDAYLKAMFSEGPEHDETLKRLQGIPVEEWIKERQG